MYKKNLHIYMVVCSCTVLRNFMSQSNKFTFKKIGFRLALLIFSYILQEEGKVNTELMIMNSKKYQSPIS